jgi:hypothetical protein
MSEIILCLHCQRPLRLPADYQADLARCPSCKTTFSVRSASVAPALVQTSLPPPRELSDPAVRSRQRNVDRTSRNPCLIVALVLSGVFLIMGVGVATLVVIVCRMQPPGSNPAAQVEEDEEQLRERNRQAFKNRKPLTEDEIAKQVKPLLNTLGSALQDGNPGRISVNFDLARMVNEMAADGGALPLHNAKDRRDFRSGLALGLSVSLSQRSQVLQWNETEVRKVK